MAGSRGLRRGLSSAKGNFSKPVDDKGIVAWVAESPSKRPVTATKAKSEISDPQSGFELQLIPVDLNRVPPILLQTFFVVAEVGQISEAARRLHLSQPAVTGHIRRSEANLETTLFIRSARGVTLTPLGTRLRERLHHVFTELEQVLSELDLSREVTGIVALAASTTLARYFVPRIFLASINIIRQPV